ncbi:MAG: flagellar biosynthetic protein FliO [Methylophaga sp.]|nr:flagellar biosynthetic protein FliO [Methylophaga sp.]
MMTLLTKVSSFFTLLLLSSFSMAAGLDDKTSLASKTLSSPPVSTGALVETLLGLLLVLAIIAFLVWLLRKTGQFQTSSNSEMHIVANLALGPRERAILLQVGKQQILVGVTSQHVQTLHVLDEPINTDNKQSNSSRFADKLQQMMQQKGKS